MNRLMIDLETLGRRPGSVVATLGAVVFDEQKIHGRFYRRLDLEDCEAHGLKVDADTARWWMKQPLAPSDEITTMEDRRRLSTVIREFVEWQILACPQMGEVWCKGASFDFPILVAAFDAVGVEVPWKFSQERCYRTVAALHYHVPFIPPTVKHHALHDAAAQASHLIAIAPWAHDAGS